MIKVFPKKKAEPVDCTVTFRGEEIILSIRPWDDDEIEAIRKKHRKKSYAKDPDTGRMVIVQDIDDMAAFSDDLFDHLLFRFSGFGDESGMPLPVNRVNKLAILLIPPKPGEDDLAKIIMDRSKALALEIALAEEEKRKNS